MIDVAIIDYKMSNLFSVQAACNKIGLSSQITSDKNVIMDSKVAILPGVGAFGEAMKHIKEYKLDETIFEFVESGKPFLGICLGLQLLFEHGEEFGSYNGLGLLKGSVKKFKIQNYNNIKYPVPQIGWNRIAKYNQNWNNSLLSENEDGDFMYFVHSYYVLPENKNIIISTTKYGEIEYCSSVMKDNIFACQYHPEKSGESGLKIYKKIKEYYCL
jgi:imidazole glycerol-phosphate synthase subunit HisH